MTKNIAILGIGNVGQAITGALLKHGFHVTAGARDPKSKSVQEAVARFPALKVASVVDAVKSADFVFLTVPYDQGVATVQSAGDALNGKILIDVTNPIGPNLTHGLNNTTSGTEVVQAAAPHAFVVKAYTTIGVENMEDPTFPGYGKGLPAMFIAGNDADAKKKFSEVLTTLGWEPVDCGPASSSLHLEHLTLLWIKLARVYGKDSHVVWALLRK